MAKGKKGVGKAGKKGGGAGWQPVAVPDSPLMDRLDGGPEALLTVLVKGSLFALMDLRLRLRPDCTVGELGQLIAARQGGRRIDFSLHAEDTEGGAAKFAKNNLLDEPSTTLQDVSSASTSGTTVVQYVFRNESFWQPFASAVFEAHRPKPRPRSAPPGAARRQPSNAAAEAAAETARLRPFSAGVRQLSGLPAASFILPE